MAATLGRKAMKVSLASIAKGKVIPSAMMSATEARATPVLNY